MSEITHFQGAAVYSRRRMLDTVGTNFGIEKYRLLVQASTSFSKTLNMMDDGAV